MTDRFGRHINGHQFIWSSRNTEIRTNIENGNNFKQESFQDLRNGVNSRSKKDSNKGRLNEDGETVPEFCIKCNSKVELYLRGEPVWCCSNKKCNKFYGVFPFSENKHIQEASLFNTKTFEAIDANIKRSGKPTNGTNNGKVDNNMVIKKLPSRFKDENVQEAMFDAGFNNLRFKLAEALKDKFKISNIMRGTGMNNDKFVISSVDDDDVKINVINVNNGVKVPGYFNNIALSRAFDKIMELLTSPQFLVEYSVDTIDDNDEPDLSSFGKHGGDDLPNNEYDLKEIEILNELVASESSAMSEYFNASKNSKIDILRRLYSDIGEEERFHTEQLLHAKSVITGEKYEPRDPEVKKEYEELLELGMDEETALNTVSDRFSISKSIDDEADDVNMEELENDINIIEHAITHYNNYIDELDIISESTTLTRDEINAELNRQVDIFTEAFFMSEAVYNVSPDTTHGVEQSPIAIIIRGMRAIWRFILQLIRKIKTFVRRVRHKQKVRNEWIKDHGIKGLFASGISMYFYNDKLYDVTREIGKRIGIPDTGRIVNSNYKYEKIRFNSISQGLSLISGVVLTKSKIIVNEKNEAELAEIFFGYTPNKFKGNEKSNNVYNILDSMADMIESFTKITEGFIKKAQNLESDPHSIYYKNRKEYDKAIDSFKIVMKGFSRFSKALAHDMSVIMRLNNGILEETNKRDSDDSIMKW
jgi:rubrerythrin